MWLMENYLRRIDVLKSKWIYVQLTEHFTVDKCGCFWRFAELQSWAWPLSQSFPVPFTLFLSNFISPLSYSISFLFFSFAFGGRKEGCTPVLVSFKNDLEKGFECNASNPLSFFPQFSIWDFWGKDAVLRNLLKVSLSLKVATPVFKITKKPKKSFEILIKGKVFHSCWFQLFPILQNLHNLNVSGFLYVMESS